MVDGFVSSTGLGSRNKICPCAVLNKSISPQRDNTKDCIIFTVNNTTDHVDSCPCPDLHYRGADKSLARPGRKQATTTEDFDFHIFYL
jgi:hypothetical protein